MSKKTESTEETVKPKSRISRKILIWTGTAAGIALAYVFVRNSVTVEVSTEESSTDSE